MPRRGCTQYDQDIEMDRRKEEKGYWQRVTAAFRHCCGNLIDCFDFWCCKKECYNFCCKYDDIDEDTVAYVRDASDDNLGEDAVMTVFSEQEIDDNCDNHHAGGHSINHSEGHAEDIVENALMAVSSEQEIKEHCLSTEHSEEKYVDQRGSDSHGVCDIKNEHLGEAENQFEDKGGNCYHGASDVGKEHLERAENKLGNQGGSGNHGADHAESGGHTGGGNNVESKHHPSHSTNHHDGSHSTDHHGGSHSTDHHGGSHSTDDSGGHSVDYSGGGGDCGGGDCGGGY